MSVQVQPAIRPKCACLRCECNHSSSGIGELCFDCKNDRHYPIKRRYPRSCLAGCTSSVPFFMPVDEAKHMKDVHRIELLV